MSEAFTRQPVPRGLAALMLACAMTVPMGMSVPASSAPTHRVLLGASGELQEVTAAVTAAGGRVVQTYEVAQALLADLPDAATVPQGSFAIPNLAMKFNAMPTSAVGSDDLNTFKQTIGAPGGNSGSGVTVAVVDTGVDPKADIDVVKHVNVSGDVAGDGLGHGTFMAGLVAGNDSTYGGVASGAQVLDVQVAAADGSTDLSRVLGGLQAVADDPSVQVAMLALSSGGPLPPSMDPLTMALDRLWSRGVTVVVASGNDGPGQVSSPATDPNLLVVGAQDEADTAVRSDDTVPDFSSYGKVFREQRPDVVAPGVSLISTAAKGSEAYLQNPGSHVGDGFLKGTGTSMSAAVAAGAVATLLAQRPSLTPDQAKRLVLGTAEKTRALRLQNGAGKGALDLAAALTTKLSAVPALEQESGSNAFGPAEGDEALWAQFAMAWEAGDLPAVAKAWSRMTEQTRKWAANAWSMTALVRALQSGDDTWDGRRWAGRRWATQDWEGRRWATDEWVGRRWADEQWVSQVWEGRRWAGRRWASVDWLAFAWTLRESATDQDVQDLWTDEQWDGRRWAGRRWAGLEWVGRRWASDAWEGRRWADFTFDGRRWAEGAWTGRRWADFTFEGRRWATEVWSGRRWATQGW